MKMEGAKKVLVLGEDTRSFLAVIRSLAAAGYQVHVVCFNQKSPAAASRYITTTHSYNHHAYTHAHWFEKIVALNERYRFDLVVPCDERAIYPLWLSRDRLPASLRIAISNDRALDVFFDKWKTKRTAIDCRIPVSPGKVTKPQELDYDALASLYGDSFVIKPLQSFEEEKLFKRQNVSIIRNPQDFRLWKHSCPAEETFLVERYFAGKGEGISVFSVEGEIVAGFAHARVSEPHRGGGSSYRTSIPLEPDKLRAVEQLCQATLLTGVAMFEFRTNKVTREWILVEVNCRFWGSLPLALYAGVDFPALYARYLMDSHLPAHPITTYKIGVFARNLTADFYQLKRDVEIYFNEKNWVSGFAVPLRWFASFGRIVLAKECIDSFDRHDKKPFFKELGLLVADTLAVLSRRVPLFTQKNQHAQCRKMLAALKCYPHRRIVFVCYGNIMRSPFAELMLKQQLRNTLPYAGQTTDTSPPAEGKTSCEPVPQIISFGFHPYPDRPSPDNAWDAAKKLGIDLSEHRSRRLKNTDLQETDIVICFDDQNYQMLENYYRPRFLFGAADILIEGNRCRQIADPYNEDVEGVVACYRQIAKMTAKLARYMSMNTAEHTIKRKAKDHFKAKNNAETDRPIRKRTG